MPHPALPDSTQLPAFLGGVLGALTCEGEAPTELQQRLLAAIVQAFDTGAPDVRQLDPLDATDVAEALGDPALHQTVAHLAVVLELCRHPVPPRLEEHLERYLRALGVDVPYLSILRDTARGHVAMLHADMVRNSWYTEQTIHGVLHGRLTELVRSKLSYYAVGHDEAIANRWRALADCPEGSWGHGVSEFYRIHGFALPGEHHGIYEIGAHHDWVHVLCDYGTDPEGEIDVFAFIATTMDDPRGLVQFLFTLALFQNATIDTVGGKHVAIARADTLADAGAAERLGDTLRRAVSCTVDVMGGVDHFALADAPLEELRGRWSIPPKQVPGRGWRDAPGVQQRHPRV